MFVINFESFVTGDGKRQDGGNVVLLRFADAVANGGVANKRPKLSKGSSSKDAYMLVYRQRGEGWL
jgi:hypothetical protein